MSPSSRISARIFGAALKASSDWPVVSPIWIIRRTPASLAIAFAAAGRPTPSSAMPGETILALTPIITSLRDRIDATAASCSMSRAEVTSGMRLTPSDPTFNRA